MIYYWHLCYLKTDPFVDENRLANMPIKTTIISSCWNTFRYFMALPLFCVPSVVLAAIYPSAKAILIRCFWKSKALHKTIERSLKKYSRFHPLWIPRQIAKAICAMHLCVDAWKTLRLKPQKHQTYHYHQELEFNCLNPLFGVKLIKIITENFSHAWWKCRISFELGFDGAMCSEASGLQGRPTIVSCLEHQKAISLYILTLGCERHISF